MVVTLQLEVAQRLVAGAGQPDYGVLSLLIQLRYEPHGHFKVPADCFFPAPDVDSACVTLKRRELPLLPVELHGTFDHLVKLSFSQRRKMMLKLLKPGWPADELASAFERIGLSPQIRAEKVTLKQFAALAEILTTSRKP
jgi:16S rRNA (adenine1518-N6/adenine1519-N6)-dimethyltransferase